MKRLLLVATLSLGLPPAMPGLADVVKIPVASQAQEHSELSRPRNGMNKEQVKASFGEPVDWNDAVGDPPISRWEYEHYYVYFEFDLVLHTVLKHRPKGPINGAKNAEAGQ
jgi:hypothetical protein